MPGLESRPTFPRILVNHETAEISISLSEFDALRAELQQISYKSAIPLRMLWCQITYGIFNQAIGFNPLCSKNGKSYTPQDILEKADVIIKNPLAFNLHVINTTIATMQARPWDSLPLIAQARVIAGESVKTECLNRYIQSVTQNGDDLPYAQKEDLDQKLYYHTLLSTRMSGLHYNEWEFDLVEFRHDHLLAQAPLYDNNLLYAADLHFAQQLLDAHHQLENNGSL